jgi:hypothetical protein
MSKQSSDMANAKNSKVAGTGVKSVKQGYPTSVPGNVKPSGNSTSGSSQSSNRGKQGE